MKPTSCEVGFCFPEGPARTFKGTTMETRLALIGTILVIAVAVVVMVQPTCGTDFPPVSSDELPPSISDYTSSVLPILSSVSSATTVYLIPMERGRTLTLDSAPLDYTATERAAASYADQISACRESWDGVSPPQPLERFHLDYASWLRVEENSARLLAMSASLRDIEGISIALDVRQSNFDDLKDCIRRFEDTIGHGNGPSDDIIL